MSRVLSRVVDPRVAGVRLSMQLHLYRVRLRSHGVQELLAGSGIAVGVALVLGVGVANTSMTNSATDLVHRLIGPARLQLAARSSEGFDERLARTSTRLAGVRVAAAVLRENIAVVGPRGREAVQLLGLSPAVASLGAVGTRDFGPGGLRLAGGLILPAGVATATGAEPGERVTILARGAARTITVGAVLGGPPFGALAFSPVAVTLLGVAQRLTGLPGRVTQVLLEPRRGAETLVAGELRRLAAGRLDVVAADNGVRLLDQAAEPNELATSLFSAISVMVGFLLALNAVLLTVPERRRLVADLRMQGYDWRQILALLGFQGMALGVAASALGVVLGVLLSRSLFQRIPAHLLTAFPIGSQETLRTGTVAFALGCGVLATLLASLAPLFDLRPGAPPDAVLRGRSGGSEVLAHRTAPMLALAGAASVALITALVLVEASTTILGVVALALSTLCVIPSLLTAVGRGLRWIGERVASSALVVAVSELRTLTTRSAALAGVAALAVYGSVATEGAHADLLRGLDVNFSEYLRTAEVWVTTGGNDLATNAFDPEGATTAIARAPGVESVRAYQGAFLDVGPRRLWIIARPAADTPLIPASQLLGGSLARATRLLGDGGWATISDGLAAEHHLAVGGFISLPTPAGPARLGVAAITTNLGWSPGAVIINSVDYRRYWQTEDPTALEVNLRPGVTPGAGRRAVAQALGHRPGLGVQSLGEREAQYAGDSRQGLRAVNEIATLLLIAAALALASALSAAIWQRRARLASLKIQGYDTRQLWRGLLLESVIVLGVGCAVGAAAGVYGHALASRWLRRTTGYPAPFSIGLSEVLLTLGLLATVALGVIALTGLAAARAPARTGSRE